VHADDLGLTRSVNEAFLAAMTAGCIRSGSAMVPCPHFSDVVEIGARRPEADIGLHLTLTNEPISYRWKPVAPVSRVPSLVDGEGNFHQSWTPKLKIDVRHVEIELQAQVEHAYASGLRPTHLDSHVFLLQMKAREIFEIYLRVARQYRLPVLVSRGWFGRLPYMPECLRAEDAVLDEVITVGPKVSPQQWPDFYRRALGALRPGLTELLVHPGFDNEELRAFYGGRSPWGAAWRQRDFDFLMSDEFRDLLVQHGIQVITWREIAAKLN
jgi:chitin disaccharide deacetylase